MPDLDLHGMTHKEAQRAVDRLANDYFRWGSDEEADINTGHSSSMIKAVIKVLEDYDITYYVGGFIAVDDGYIKIVGIDNARNAIY